MEKRGQRIKGGWGAERVSYDLKQYIGLLQLEKQGAEWNIVELGYNVMKGTEYFVSFYTSIVITEVYNIMVDNDELIGTTEYHPL